MKKSLIILLSCFCLFAFSGSTLAQQINTEQAEQPAKFFPEGMTYDGALNPKDVVDKTKYKPQLVAKTPDPRILIVLWKAIQKDSKFKYVAVVYFSTRNSVKIVAVVYLDEYNNFHQIGLMQLYSNHFTENVISKDNKKKFTQDFNKFFGLELGVKTGV